MRSQSWISQMCQFIKINSHRRENTRYLLCSEYLRKIIEAILDNWSKLENILCLCLFENHSFTIPMIFFLLYWTTVVPGTKDNKGMSYMVLINYKIVCYWNIFVYGVHSLALTYSTVHDKLKLIFFPSFKCYYTFIAKCDDTVTVQDQD